VVLDYSADWVKSVVDVTSCTIHVQTNYSYSFWRCYLSKYEYTIPTTIRHWGKCEANIVHLSCNFANNIRRSSLICSCRCRAAIGRRRCKPRCTWSSATFSSRQVLRNSRPRECVQHNFDWRRVVWLSGSWRQLAWRCVRRQRLNTVQGYDFSGISGNVGEFG